MFNIITALVVPSALKEKAGYFEPLQQRKEVAGNSPTHPANTEAQAAEQSG